MEFLRGYAGCPVPEGLPLAIELALDAASERLELAALADRVAYATGLDRRVCFSAILHLLWEGALFIDVCGPAIGPDAVISRWPL